MRSIAEPEVVANFADITEEEILVFWRSLKTRRLTMIDTWDAIVISATLDIAFKRTRSFVTIQ